MKNILLKTLPAVLFIAATVSATGCKSTAHTRTTKSTTVNSSGSLPPGQAKKINGDQSAKKYAPGQQKKKSKGKKKKD
jgi:hypothetical protein